MTRFAPLLALVLLVPSAPAFAQSTDGVNVGLSGYYRVRPYYLKDPNGEPEDVSRYFAHRLRLEPHLWLNEYVGVHAQVDALDGYWGGNPGNVLTQSTADRAPNLVVRRAYAAVTTPVGEFRIGRMPSQWGLGILSNDGDGFRNDFGDAYGGDVYDRILFVTKPLGIDAPLTVAVLYDKIVETDPATGVIGTLNEGDVDEAGIIANWQQGHLSAGTYTLYRTQTKTDTTVWIPDLLVRYHTRRFHLDVEGVGIFGETSAVTAFFTPGEEAALGGESRTFSSFTLARPAFDIQMIGSAAEAGFWVQPWLDVALEAGYASGDEAGTAAFDDGKLTSFTFDPDYNVGLILFEYANAFRTRQELAAAAQRFDQNVAGGTLRELCVATCVNETRFPSNEEALNDFLQRTGAIFIPSNGAVRNATYLFPKVRFDWKNGWKAIAAVLWATANDDVVNAAGDDARAYGLELDGGVSYDYTANFRVGLQSGILFPGEVFNEPTGDTAPPIWTVQPRMTVLF